MGISEKVAYLKGLAEGLTLDTESKEGKLIAAIIDVLDDMAEEIADMQDEMVDIEDGLDAVSDDLSDVEETLYEMEDEDEWDDDEDEEEDCFMTTCPECEEEEEAVVKNVSDFGVESLSVAPCHQDLCADAEAQAEHEERHVVDATERRCAQLHFAHAAQEGCVRHADELFHQRAQENGEGDRENLGIAVGVHGSGGGLAERECGSVGEGSGQTKTKSLKSLDVSGGTCCATGRSVACQIDLKLFVVERKGQSDVGRPALLRIISCWGSKSCRVRP